jgi:hypothetical protein
MRRRLVTILASVSLVLFAATLGLWVQSHFVDDMLLYRVKHGDSGFSEYMLEDVRGSLFFATHTSPASLPPTVRDGFDHERVDASRVRVMKETLVWRIGFGFNRQPGGWVLQLPLWLFAIVFLAGPAYVFSLRMRTRRRARAGRCAACGYDLRASPERCPECGTLTPG